LIIFICLAAAGCIVVVFSFLEKRKSKKVSIKPIEDISHEQNNLINYNEYTLSRLEKLKYISIAAAVLICIGFIFFKNPVLCLLLSGFSFFYPIIKRKSLIKKRKSELNLQFKDALGSISTSLSAGRSVEEAFVAALADLKIIYANHNALIIKEFELINRRVQMNGTLELALKDFVRRADIEDISNFADVFIICKKTGGNLIEVIKNASNVINQKIEIKNEIEVIVSEQKFSQKILTVMPFGLLITIMTSSPDYIEPLYSGQGHLIMLVVLGLILAAYFISIKIIDIKV
jgi:tight adherence protein B